MRRSCAMAGVTAVGSKIKIARQTLDWISRGLPMIDPEKHVDQLSMLSICLMVGFTSMVVVLSWLR